MSHDEELILAIDLGTSGPKVALVTLTGEVLAWRTRPTKLLLSDGGGAEQDPEDWWQAIVAAARALFSEESLDPARVVALAVTSHWAGVVAVDANGKPLRPAIIWMDSRGARYVTQIVGMPPRVSGYGLRRLARWLRLTGGAPSLIGKEPIAHHLLLKHEFPEVHASAHQFLEPKDWLNHRLTGEFTATYDSIAVLWATDNRDLRRVDYDERLLGWIGVDRRKLPRLLAATDIIGTLTPAAARELGLREQVVVVGGTPDVHSAAVGSGAVRDFEAHAYIGTSSWLSCHVPFKKTSIADNMASLPAALPGRYYLANSQETAGACLEHLRDSLLFADDGLGTGPIPADFWARIEQLAAQAPAGSGGLMFTPWLYGERCPVADHQVRAGFHNLSLQTRRSDLVRAVYEGVAYNNRWLLAAVERFIGRSIAHIRFIGGGASSALWCQIMADVLDREIHQVVAPRACNARGAALLASLALGALTVDDIPARVGVERVFSPAPEHRELHARRFSEFLQLYRRNRAIHARLNAS